MVGAKCTLLARMDAHGQDPSGQAGEATKVWGPFWTSANSLAAYLHLDNIHGGGVTVPYRNGLLEPMHRTGSGYDV